MKVWRIHFQDKRTGVVGKAPEGNHSEELIRRLCAECKCDPDLDHREHWVEEEEEWPDP